MKRPKHNRQTLRKISLLVSFAFFPYTILYLSPGPPLMSLKAGVVNLSVLVILGLFLSGFFFRRAFCGWICPGGGCQVLAGAVNNSRLERKRTNWIRIILISVWIMMMLMTILFKVKDPELDLGNPGAGKFATSEIRFYLPYIPTVLFMILFVYIFGRRGFCHRACWIYPLLAASTRLGRWLRFPGLFVQVRHAEECNSCNLCTKHCTMSIDVKSVVQEEKSLPAYCIQCGSCVDQCRNKVLSYSFGRQV